MRVLVLFKRPNKEEVAELPDPGAGKIFKALNVALSSFRKIPSPDVTLKLHALWLEAFNSSLN
jgi:hypothetical protein